MTSTFKFQNEIGHEIEVSWDSTEKGFYFGSVLFAQGQEPMKIERFVDRENGPSFIINFTNALQNNGYSPVEAV